MLFDCQQQDWHQAYLTRSMTLSLGAELTGSLLIMMISSPGTSLPSDGPPANTPNFRRWNCTQWSQFLKCSVFWLKALLDAYSSTAVKNQWIISISGCSSKLRFQSTSSHVHAVVAADWMSQCWRATLPGVTERTTTGFSLPATNPKPSTGSRLMSTFRGAGGTNLSPSRRTSSRELLWEMWLKEWVNIC